MNPIRIPKYTGDDNIKPCWIETANTKGELLRPHVKCNCGIVTSIGNHHVHKDGRVTASYYHSKSMPGGCEWHVFIVLDGYNGPEWKPGRNQAELQQMFE